MEISALDEWQCAPWPEYHRWHDLQCPILWNIVPDFFNGEDSISLEARLCLSNPSIKSLQRLACACDLYHAVKNDIACVTDGVLSSPRIVQSRASEFIRALRFFV